MANIDINNDYIGFNVRYLDSADGVPSHEVQGYNIQIDTRSGWIDRLIVDTERAFRIGDIANIMRQKADGTYREADVNFLLLSELDPGWVEENGITREWLQGLI